MNKEQRLRQELEDWRGKLYENLEEVDEGHLRVIFNDLLDISEFVDLERERREQSKRNSKRHS